MLCGVQISVVAIAGGVEAVVAGGVIWQSRVTDTQSCKFSY